MIIRRETLLAVLPATCEDKGRYYLQAIQVEPDGSIVATDGHILLVAKESGRFPDSEFPTKEPLPTYNGDATVPVMLTTELVAKLIGAMPKKARIPILAACQVGQNGAGTFAAATDLETAIVKHLDPPGEYNRFPDWKRVMPAADRPALHLSLAVEVLEDLIKAAKAIGGRDKGQTITFHIPTEHKYHGKVPGPEDPKDRASNGKIEDGIRIEFRGSGITVEGVAMPCRDKA